MAPVATDSDWFVTLLLSLSHGVQHFFQRMIPALFPILVLEFNLPFWQLGLLITVSAMGSGLTQAPIGILSDRYDRRNLLVGGIGLISIGYLFFSLSGRLGGSIPWAALDAYAITPQFVVMLVGMTFIGVGTAALHPVGYPMISENVSAERKGKALGFWGSTAKFGDAAAPLFFGALILVTTWDLIVFGLGLVAFAYAAALYVVLGRSDIRTLPPSHSDSDGESSEIDVWHTDYRIYIYPMLALVVFFSARMIAARGINAFLPTFITDVYGYSYTLFSIHIPPASLANFYYTALLVVAGVIQLATGDLSDRYDTRYILIAFLLVAAVGTFILGFAALSPLGLLAAMVIVGGGFWGLNPARDKLVSEISPADREGRTFGYLWSFAQIIGSLSPFLVGYVADVAGIRQGIGWLTLGPLVAALGVASMLSRRVYLEHDPSGAAVDD